MVLAESLTVFERMLAKGLIVLEKMFAKGLHGARIDAVRK